MGGNASKSRFAHKKPEMRRFAALCLLLPTGRAHEWLSDVGEDLSCSAASVDPNKTVVVAVGDSITAGATCGTWKGGFVKALADSLGA